jgi:tetratricopeptide (TPR) repeat protein
MKHLTISLLLFFMVVSSAGAVDFSAGVSAYDKASYQEAVNHFRAAVQEDPHSAEAWYNLGNACYKSGSPGKAIAAYRKALKLKPGDPDILFNLRFVHERTVDKLSPPEPSLIVRLVDRPASLLSVSGWSLATLLLAFLGLTLFLVYIFSASVSVKRIAFFSSFGIWAAAFLSFSLTAHRYWYLRDDTAVITANSASMLSEPNENGTRLMLLKEGASLRFLEFQGEWAKVVLPDGSQAFVKKESVDVI